MNVDERGQDGRPLWFRDYPDEMTEAILLIDMELEKTRRTRDLINRHAICMVCGEHGVHAH